MCNKLFEPIRITHILCDNPKCKNRWRYLKIKAVRLKNATQYTERKCIICGIVFTPTTWNEITCSKKCKTIKRSMINRLARLARVAKYHKPNAVCVECGSDYYRSHTSPIRCSICSKIRYQTAVKMGEQMPKELPLISKNQRIKNENIRKNKTDFLDVTFEGRGMMDANICPFG